MGLYPTSTTYWFVIAEVTYLFSTVCLHLNNGDDGNNQLHRSITEMKRDNPYVGFSNVSYTITP